MQKKCIFVLRRDVMEAAYVRLEKQWRKCLQYWHFKSKISNLQRVSLRKNSLLQIQKSKNVLWFLQVTGDVLVAFEFEMHHMTLWHQFYNIQRSVGVITSMPFDPGGVFECTTFSKDLKSLIVERFSSSFLLQLWTW